MQDLSHLYSKESEMMILGSMLTNINSLKEAAASLDAFDFHHTEHQVIFAVLKTAYKDDKPIDVHLVCEELKKQGKLQPVGGAAYILYLAQYAGTSAFIEEYAQGLKEFSAKRRLIDLSRRIMSDALDGKTNAPALVQNAQESLKLIEKNRDIEDKHPIRLLSGFEQNFLLETPLKKPMILECSDDDGNPIGFLPKGIVGILVGAGGVGKTHFLAQLALSIATGTPFLNKFTTTQWCGEGGIGNVFLGLGENQYEDIHRILHKSSKSLKGNPELLREASDRIAVFSFCGQQASFIEDKQPSRYFRNFKRKLLEATPPGGWTLIILDPVSRLLGADAETDNAAATQFIALMEELSLELPGNPTVLFVHHVNKASFTQGTGQEQSAARGASAITDGARWQVNLIKGADAKVVLKMTKSNFTNIFPEQTLSKDEEGCLFQPSRVDQSKSKIKK